MSELSQHAKLIKAIEIAKGAQVGIELSYFDVLEVAGELNEAKEVVAMLNARIAELEAYIDQLIEIGGWAITGMTIATSYSPGEIQNLAEKKSDDWHALIKNLKECDKEKERER